VYEESTSVHAQVVEKFLPNIWTSHAIKPYKVVGSVTKTAEEVTIGSHKSTAGLTAKKEAKVTLRE